MNTGIHKGIKKGEHHEQLWGEKNISLSTALSPKFFVSFPLQLGMKKTSFSALNRTYTHFPQP
jgi:hypothetical protein